MEITFRVDPQARRVIVLSPTEHRRSWRSTRAAGATGCESSSSSGCSNRSAEWCGSISFACEPDLALYASPINFDPDAPFFPISDPPEYAGDLAAQIGLYHTTGMVEDHAGSEQRTDLRGGVSRPVRDRLARARGDDAPRAGVVSTGLFYCLFDTPDRVQHLFWRFREPDHPANRGKPPDSRLRRVIDDAYRRCDAIVGKALEYSDDQTLFIALSDHGFNSFQRGVHLNTWLLDNGFLALKDGVEPGEAAGDLLRQVDWARTRAYALGLSGIYLNLKGREEQGIVLPEDAGSVKAAIAQGLTGLPDPERRAMSPSTACCRARRSIAAPTWTKPPTLWSTSPRDTASRGRRRWGASPRLSSRTTSRSGAAITSSIPIGPRRPVHEPAVPGETARLLDLAPTILAALGVPKGPAMEGESLLP